MLNRGTIFLGLMLTGTLAVAALVSQDESSGNMVVPAIERKMPSNNRASEHKQNLPTLLLDRLVRTEPVRPEKDPFAGKTWYVPPPPPPPVQRVQEVVQPTAPPLPFSYMGRMVEEDGHVIVYLAQGSRALSVSTGDTIDGIYHFDSISSGQLVLTYLPLGIRQTLNFPAGTLSSGLETMTSVATSTENTAQSLPEHAQAQGAEVQP